MRLLRRSRIIELIPAVIPGFITLCVALLLCCAQLRPALAQTPPARLTPDELRTLDTTAETIGGPFPGALVIPPEPKTVFDERYTQPFHTLCYVYVGEQQASGQERTGYVRRFMVHAPDASALPLTRRVARMLLLLYGECRERLRRDHTSGQTLDVWLMARGGSGQSADAGGEQFRNQIYLYSIFSDRRPIEWARETAHEYGHYALPGVAGFTAPEEWANGVLGERLFLKWLHDDLRAGRLQPDGLPFVTPEELDDYIARQIAPLIDRISTVNAADNLTALLSRRDATGMDNYTALALYIDTIYGSPTLLSALAYTEPEAGAILVMASDFLRGVLTSLRASDTLTISPPSLSAGKTEADFKVYLPAGSWTVTPQGTLRSWHFEGQPPKSGTGSLTVRSASWRRLSLSRSPSVAPPPRLLFTKK